MLQFIKLSFLFLSFGAWAIPEAPVDSLDFEPAGIEYLSPLADFDFNGIVKLSNCSASLVHFQGQPKASKAYVLTNGHCIQKGWGGFLKPGEVIHHKQVVRRMNAYKTLQSTVRIQSEELVYATMTDTDSALYRLNTTYEALEAQGVYSFEMSPQRPTPGTPMHIVSGYWKRGFSCEVEAIVPMLREADWTFRNSIRYSEDGCEVYGGTSGSPILEAGQRLVIGVNNTGNESGGRCTMNNPCEVNKDGSTKVIPGRGYGQQTYWFYSCLNSNFEIDLDTPGCLLPQ